MRDSSWWTFGRRAWTAGSAGDQAVDVSEPEESADTVHHRVGRRGPQPGLAEVADVQLDVSTLDADQRVEPIRLAPGEPAVKLVRVQLVGAAGVPGQVGDGRQLGR